MNIHEIAAAELRPLADAAAITSSLPTLQPQEADSSLVLLAKITAALATGAPLTEVRSTALETAKVLKASSGRLHSLAVFNSSASAQFILLINAAAVPGDGAVSLLYPPIPIAAGAMVVLDLPRPVEASTGIVACNSSTGSFTKTAGSADCAFYAQVS